MRSKATLLVGCRGERQQRLALDPVDLVEDQDLRLADVLQPVRGWRRRRRQMPRSASISSSTTSASLAPPQAVVTMARSSRRCGRKMPGVSTKTICALSCDGDAAHDGAGRLHLVGDDRHLGADQLVDQRRLAGIGRADQGDEAGAADSAGLSLGGHRSCPLVRPDAFAQQNRRAAACFGLALGAAAAPLAGAKPATCDATVKTGSWSGPFAAARCA